MRTFFFFEGAPRQPPARREARLAGRLLQAVAVVHALFGLWMGRGPIAAMAREGFVDAVDPHLDRNMVFWFLLASPLLWMLGRFVLWLEARRLGPPAWLGWHVLALAAVGALLMPASGFWLILPPGALLVRAARGA